MNELYRDSATQLALLDRLAGTSGLAASFASGLKSLRQMEQQLADIALLGSEEERDELQDMISEVNAEQFRSKRQCSSCLHVPCADQYVFCTTLAPVHTAAFASAERQLVTAAIKFGCNMTPPPQQMKATLGCMTPCQRLYMHRTPRQQLIYTGKTCSVSP